MYRIGLNLAKVNYFVQHDIVSQVKFCEKKRALADQLEEWMTGKDFRMSPFWTPNTESEVENSEQEVEQDLPRPIKILGCRN